jgi:hypothetical protein
MQDVWRHNSKEPAWKARVHFNTCHVLCVSSSIERTLECWKKLYAYFRSRGLRQVVAANSKHSTVGGNPMCISIATRTFHSHGMGSVFQNTGWETSNVGKNHLFLPRKIPHFLASCAPRTQMTYYTATVADTWTLHIIFYSGVEEKL